MTRIPLLLAALLALATVPVLAEPEGAVSFGFPGVRPGESDQRTIERFLQRQGTFRCELVGFEVKKLIGLIDSLDKGELEVEDSSVRLTLFSEIVGEFEGIHFEVGREREIPGPYSWGGVLKGAPEVTVNFIIDRFRIATMILDAGEIVYRTHVSRDSGHYILCKTDGTKATNRIE